MAYQLGTSIYYNTIKDIPIGQELLVWYAPQYAKKLGKSVTPDGVSKGKEKFILQHHQRYCKWSFVRSILISRSLDQVLIHGVLYLRKPCINTLFYV